MKAERRKTLEARGYKVYDHIGDAVGMTEEEKELLDLRITLAIKVRKRREKMGLSQQDLAARLKISERRVARIEWTDPAISLDEILRAYAALGGRVAITELQPHSVNGKVKKKGNARAK